MKSRIINAEISLPGMPEKFKIVSLTEKDFPEILEMEKKIYPKLLVQGQALLDDIKKGNGLEYSIVVLNEKMEKIAYLISINGQAQKEEPCVYLEDIAVMPDFQRKGVGWMLIKKIVRKLQAKAKKEGKAVLWSMNLRKTSQNLFEKHREDLKKMGVISIKEELLTNYYKNNESGLYKVFVIEKPKQ